MPEFHQTFTFGHWQLDPDNASLRLSYHVEGAGELTEALTFPAFDLPQDTATSQALTAACQLLHWLAGVSYAKMGLPRQVMFSDRKPDSKSADFLRTTWLHGLAELAHNHKVSLQGRLQFEHQSTIPDNWRLHLPHRSLVPFGGGKDSIVTVEQLKALHKPMRLFVVGDSPVILHAAAKTGIPVYQVRRQLDEKLLSAPPDRFFNGHVPVTAINSAIAVVAALLHGYDSIVFSNERSAESHNTVNADGLPVNHQYSKGFAFEKAFQAQINRTVSPDLRYFSLQRPWSELAILQQFSKYDDYFDVFTSCNRNFHLGGSRNSDNLWCGDCPKCRFVFLGLAPFIAKDRLLTIFGHNLLNEPKQLFGFEELLGVRGIKPFECVGEIIESRVAFCWLANTPEWASDHVIKLLRHKVVPPSAREEQDVLAFHTEHAIPAEFLPHQTSCKAAMPNHFTLWAEGLADKQVAIWGFGVDGQASARYLAHHHSRCQVTVFCSPGEVPENTPAHWRFDTSPVTPARLNRFDLVIKSPGISHYQFPANEVTAPVVGSAALWFAYHRHGQVIAITGTKGKSTSTSLLAHVLRGLGHSVNLAGNIGRPLLDCVDQPARWTVLETSSYQAADNCITADVALLLNLFPEHLDWHGSEAGYYRDKLRLLEQADTALLGMAREPLVERLHAAGLPVPAVMRQAASPRWQVRGDGLHIDGQCVFTADQWALRGAHNLQNLAAVLHVAENLGLPTDDILLLAREFQPLAHRLQSLGVIGQWHWINDSIASTPHASLAALSTVETSTTTMILGGFDRQLDWHEFAQAIRSRPPACLLLTGDNAPRILDALRQAGVPSRIIMAKDLAHAVVLATCHTPAGGTVLLSPGAPSFDAFANYAERGEAFAQLARRIAVKGTQAPHNGDGNEPD